MSYKLYDFVASQKGSTGWHPTLSANYNASLDRFRVGQSKGVSNKDKK